MIDIQVMNVANEKDIIDIKNKFQNESIPVDILINNAAIDPKVNNEHRKFFQT